MKDTVVFCWKQFKKDLPTIWPAICAGVLIGIVWAVVDWPLWSAILASVVFNFAWAVTNLEGVE